MNPENILNKVGTKYKTNVSYLIPKRHSQTTLNRPSSLTNLCLPRRILSSAAIHWSINSTDLNPYINRKWKCFLHPRNLPIKCATNAHRHHTSRGEWHNTALPRVQVSKDKRCVTPTPLPKKLASTHYYYGIQSCFYCSQSYVVDRPAWETMPPVKFALAHVSQQRNRPIMKSQINASYRTFSLLVSTPLMLLQNHGYPATSYRVCQCRWAFGYDCDGRCPI